LQDRPSVGDLSLQDLPRLRILDIGRGPGIFWEWHEPLGIIVSESMLPLKSCPPSNYGVRFECAGVHRSANCRDTKRS